MLAVATTAEVFDRENKRFQIPDFAADDELTSSPPPPLTSTGQLDEAGDATDGAVLWLSTIMKCYLRVFIMSNYFK